MKKAFCVIVSLLFVVLCLPFASAEGFSLSSVPAYSGKAYVVINGNVPFFTEADITCKSFERYSELDSLGRCGTAFACLGYDLMPTDERGSISSVKPTGWHSVRYDNVDGGSLYNRCHLIGWKLAGENANRQNLITGTRMLNTQGMLPFEDMTADFIKAEHADGYDSHVMYRVTPVFTGNDLVAKGVLMEGFSAEDGGEGICFCVFCYNVQPGIIINYADGSSRLQSENEHGGGRTLDVSEAAVYVLNVSSKRFHLPDCASVGAMSPKNKREVTARISELTAQGYIPCGNCRPDSVSGGNTVFYYGDVDMNGVIEAIDARLALRASVRLQTLSANSTALADVDFNGSITSADARIILRVSVGLQTI